MSLVAPGRWRLFLAAAFTALSLLWLFASCGSGVFESEVAGVDGGEVAVDIAETDAADIAEAEAVSIPTAIPTTVDVAIDGVATDDADATRVTVFHLDESCDTRFFPGFAPDQAWCFEDWALATIDGFGVELASYRLVEGASREIATGPIIGQIDLGETLNLGIPLRVAEELCRRSAETRAASADNCLPHTSAAAASLAFVQSHLWRTSNNTPSNDAADRDVASVRTGLEYSPFVNRLASWEVAGAANGCWIRTDTITAQCAIDIRDFEGSIVDTIVVSTYPQGVVDATFEGFTGGYEVTGVATSLAAAGISIDRWVLTASSFGSVDVGMSLRDARQQLGFGLDLAGAAVDDGRACFFATPIGFVGLFYIAEAVSGVDPLDGVIQSIVVSAADYPAASGIRVGSPSDALVVTLGDDLIARDHASSPDGRYYDMPQTPAAEQLLRFESYDGEVISQIRAGRASGVTAADGCG